MIALSRELKGAHMVEQLSKELEGSATSNVDDMVVNEALVCVFNQVDLGTEFARPDADAVYAREGSEHIWAEAEEMTEDVVEDEGVVKLRAPIENFDEACELASGVMGYPIDDFQQRCLQVPLIKHTNEQKKYQYVSSSCHGTDWRLGFPSLATPQ